MCFAGMDTLFAAIHWFCRAMAVHRDIQERSQAEMDKVVGRERLPGGLSDKDQ